MGKGFEDLDVWKVSSRLAVDVYKALRACRAAVSVPSNIAEGYERNSKGDFARYINIAKGSAGELRTQIYLAKELGLFTAEQFEDFVSRVVRVSAMLNGLVKLVKGNM